MNTVKETLVEKTKELIMEFDVHDGTHKVYAKLENEKFSPLFDAMTYEQAEVIAEAFSNIYNVPVVDLSIKGMKMNLKLQYIENEFNRFVKEMVSGNIFLNDGEIELVFPPNQPVGEMEGIILNVEYVSPVNITKYSDMVERLLSELSKKYGVVIQQFITCGTFHSEGNKVKDFIEVTDDGAQFSRWRINKEISEWGQRCKIPFFRESLSKPNRKRDITLEVLHEYLNTVYNGAHPSSYLDELNTHSDEQISLQRMIMDRVENG